MKMSIFNGKTAIKAMLFQVIFCGLVVVGVIVVANDILKMLRAL